MWGVGNSSRGSAPKIFCLRVKVRIWPPGWEELLEGAYQILQSLRQGPPPHSPIVPSFAHGAMTLLSSKPGTFKTVKTRSRPCLSGKSPHNLLSCFGKSYWRERTKARDRTDEARPRAPRSCHLFRPLRRARPCQFRVWNLERYRDSSLIRNSTPP